MRQAEDAYLAGAKKLERDDLDGAEREFVQALKLDPVNRNYAIAISVTRQHRVTELVQQSTKAMQSGDPAKADTLLAQARVIDPDNPVVLEHSAPVLAPTQSALLAAGAVPQPLAAAVGQAAGQPPPAPLADRSRMISDPGAAQPWQIEAPSLAGAIRLAPTDTLKSFHLRGTTDDVLRNVASEFGIRAVIDSSVEHKPIRFDVDNVGFDRAMIVLTGMTHVFAVPMDETSVLIAKDSVENRNRLEPQMEETIYLPGSTPEQINDLATIVRNVFEVQKTAVQATGQSMVVRAPEYVLGPMNETLRDLMDTTGEVMIEVKIYEVSTTRTVNAGTTLPNQFSVFNVDQAATTIVNANQTLVQQAIAQGLISATASNLQIALALIGSGLVQSNLASNLIGVFGGGVLQTGISAATNTTLNLGLNSTDTRALDDVQLRVGDHQPATFREGNRYPIISSTYSSGLSTAASALSNVSIHGVNVASLLQQYAGGSSATIPQVTYEDLGITLKATPVIQKTGRIDMKLDLKIEALSGSTSDGNPILESRQFASDITVADGESALMVSNVSRTETAAMTGIPGLSELPGFQTPIENNTEKDTGQLVVVITPHVVQRRSNLVSGPRIAVVNPQATE
jgi:Flp pilus assembly secretin CpaC